MNIEVKRITALPELLTWRVEVIRSVFGVEPDASLAEANYVYYQQHIDNETHIAVEALVDGEKAGCGAICLTDELPSPDNPTGRCAYLMNIYVRPQYRKHGIAHAVVSYLVDEAKKLNCDKIYLETTAEGRPLYYSMGFDDMPDMMKLSNITKE